MSVNTYSLDLEAGSSQYASIADVSQTGLDITGDLTLEAWIKPETLTSSDTVLSKYDPGNVTNQRSYRFQTLDTGFIRFQVSSNGSTPTGASSTGTIATGSWYHIAVS